MIYHSLCSHAVCHHKNMSAHNQRREVLESHLNCLCLAVVDKSVATSDSPDRLVSKDGTPTRAATGSLSPRGILNLSEVACLQWVRSGSTPLGVTTITLLYSLACQHTE